MSQLRSEVLSAANTQAQTFLDGIEKKTCERLEVEEFCDFLDICRGYREVGA